jgi:hypothetical protein
MFTGPYRQLASVNTNTDGLVGWWKMDDAGGTDSSPFGHNGVVHGTPNPVIGPTSVGALNFNGTNQYIEISPATLASASDFTFSAWINKGASGGVNMTIIGMFGGTVSGQRNSIYFSIGGTSGNQLNAFEFQNDTFTAAGALDPTPGVSNNTWVHAVMAFQTSGGGLVLYANGLAVTSGLTLQSGFPSALGFTEIGVQYNNNANTYVEFFNGMIDDVRIYNRILNPDEILGLYTEAFTPPIDFEKVPFFIPPPPLPLMGQIWLA